jgi:hypothetical protein
MEAKRGQITYSTVDGAGIHVQKGKMEVALLLAVL